VCAHVRAKDTDIEHVCVCMDSGIESFACVIGALSHLCV